MSGPCPGCPLPTLKVSDQPDPVQSADCRVPQNIWRYTELKLSGPGATPADSHCCLLAAPPQHRHPSTWAAMSLDRVPDEIIQHLLHHVSPEDTLQCFQLLCHRSHRLANEGLLWRYHCRSTFRYWHPDHGFGQKLHAAVASVDWKRLFLLRARRNRTVSQLFDAILKTKVGRLRKIERICRLGYDAKDFLLVQCHAPESAPDVLARR